MQVALDLSNSDMVSQQEILSEIDTIWNHLHAYYCDASEDGLALKWQICTPFDREVFFYFADDVLPGTVVLRWPRSFKLLDFVE